MNSSAVDTQAQDNPHYQFSTYTPTSNTISAPQFSKPSSSKPKTDVAKSGSAPSPIPTASTEKITETDTAPKSKEAAMPGQWEVVEEDDEENPYAKGEQAAETAAAEPARAHNPKKRERANEDDSTLDQVEAESRGHSSTTMERVPEQYRPNILASSSSEEPVFKAKVNKGANIKKRVKQL